MRYFLQIVFYFLIAGCARQPELPTDTSFYFWRNDYVLTHNESQLLSSTGSKTNYLKYFDIVREANVTKPVSVLKNAPSGMQVVPVIFIQNKVFAGMSAEQVNDLFVKTLRLIDTVSRTHHLSLKEIQVDCDWTESTKEIYFDFLRRFVSVGLPVSATIRLHQVKYKERTGIPPVKKGVLMYYNMGAITAESTNSIYNEEIAKKYTSYLKDYPLELNLALPIFSWGIQTRDKRVVGLLNKTSEENFISDTNFVSLSSSIFKAKRSLFKNEYYYQEGDEVKIEYVSGEQLLEISDHLHEKLKQNPREIIYYDLDSINLRRYDEKIFKEIANRFN